MTVTATLLLPQTPTGDYYVDEGGSIPVRITRDSTANSDTVRVAAPDFAAGVLEPNQVETVGFAPGSTELFRDISFRVRDDALVEDFERFNLDITSVNGTPVATTFLNGAVRNTDPLPIVGLKTTTSQVVENAQGANFHFDLTRTGDDLSMETRVAVRLEPQGPTGVDSNDFSGPNAGLGTVYVVFAPNETTKTLELPIRNDADIEASETLNAYIQSAVSTSPQGRFSGEQPNNIDWAGGVSASVVIVNDDPNRPTGGGGGGGGSADERVPTYSNAGQVIRLYDTMLDRFPEPAGREFYVNLLNSGQATISSLERNFENSPEFVAKYGNTTAPQFVDLLYENTLNRDPAASEVNFYVNRINAGTPRGEVVQNFSESPEHIARVEQAYDVDFI